MQEEWRPIAGHEHFEVSSEGRVRSLDREVRNGEESSRLVRGRVLATYVAPNGYRTLRLANSANRYVHCLVAEAFHGSGEPGQEVCHRDGDKQNNRAGNLYWGTRRENMSDRIRLGEAARGEEIGNAKLTAADVLAIRADPTPNYLIAARFGLSRAQVTRIKKRQNWAWVD